MKRLLFFTLISLVFNFSFVFSQEEHDNLTANLGISFLVPVDTNLTGNDKFLNTFLLSSVSFGMGYHYNIIEGVLAPGIYGDVHLNALPALIMLFGAMSGYEVKGIDDIVPHDEKHWDERNVFFLIQTGVRLYNQFRFELFDIQPFIGLNLMSGSINAKVFKTAGILFAYKNFGLEYSYLVPWDRHLNSTNSSIHRIVFNYHFR